MSHHSLARLASTGGFIHHYHKYIYISTSTSDSLVLYPPLYLHYYYNYAFAFVTSCLASRHHAANDHAMWRDATPIVTIILRAYLFDAKKNEKLKLNASVGTLMSSRRHRRLRCTYRSSFFSPKCKPTHHRTAPRHSAFRLITPFTTTDYCPVFASSLLCSMYVVI